MIMKTPHPHAELLAEAIQDTNRKILGKHVCGDFLEEVTLATVAGSNHQWEFYFADTLPKTVSSLTNDQLFAIARKNAPNEDINCLVLRAVADAAAAKHEADITKTQPVNLKQRAVTRSQDFIDDDILTSEELQALYKNSPFKFPIF